MTSFTAAGTETGSVRREVEIVRAALCALSFSTTPQGKPIHVNRVSSTCLRLGGHQGAEMLEVLAHLREAQHLGAGYWASVPTRFVRATGITLLISALPTSELVRELSGVSDTLGHGRVAESVPDAATTQDFDDWLGSPADILTWTKEAIRESRFALQSTVHPDGDLSVYAPWLVQERRGRRGKRWVHVSEWVQGDYPSLCRQVLGKRRRYFWARIKQGKVLEEAPIAGDLLRVLYGLDVVSGTGTPVSIRIAESKARVRAIPLPKEEKRLVSALAVEEGEEGKSELVFNQHAVSAFVDLFQRLGITVRQE